jgi:hypothetical protein
MKRECGQQGSAIIFVIMMTSLLLLIPVSLELLRRTRRESKHQLNVTAQADNVAQAGLTHAVAWFRSRQLVRQSIDPPADHPFYPTDSEYPYPDAAFSPLNSSGETIDQNVGIVREFPLSEGTNSLLWARYEVARQTVNNKTDSSLSQVNAVHDISALRVSGSSAGDGLAWSIHSVGYIYRRKNPSKPFDSPQDGNEVIARSRMVTEIRRMSLSLPTAAVVTQNIGGITKTGGTCRVTGDNVGYGVYGSGGTNTATWIQATPSSNRLSIDGSYVISTTTIFGVTDYDLQMLADFRLTGATLPVLPSRYPTSSLVYVQGNATFDGSHPLRGGGVLIVTGNLTLASASNSSFSGVILVGGNATITGPALISGTLVVKGTLTLDGGIDTADIMYDPGIVSATRQQLLAYRENKSALHVFSSLK